MSIPTTQVRCERCGIVYTIALGYPASDPHGHNKDCRSDSWEPAPIGLSGDKSYSDTQITTKG